MIKGDADLILRRPGLAAVDMQRAVVSLASMIVETIDPRRAAVSSEMWPTASQSLAQVNCFRDRFLRDDESA